MSLKVKTSPICEKDSVRFAAELSPASKSKSISSMWSISLDSLKKSSTLYEAVIHLRAVEEILDRIDRNDRIKFCKSDFDTVIFFLRKSGLLKQDGLLCAIVDTITTYFDNCLIHVALPEAVLQSIFLWVPLDEYGIIPQVCKYWKRRSATDEVCRCLYEIKFLRTNPEIQPKGRRNYLEIIKRRISEPIVGDHVEVAWRGKFRLDAQDVYQGLSWWKAVVVNTNPTALQYQIHYPGWEARWDEWVDRNRLRWSVENNNVSKIKIKDRVELWCYGQSVPGAWFDTIVRKTKKDMYGVHRSPGSALIWVPRDRIRPVKFSERMVSEYQNVGEHVFYTNCVPIMSGCSIM